MKKLIGLFFILGWILSGCGPAGSQPPAEPGLPPTPAELQTDPIIVAVPTEPGDEPLIQTPPTDSGTEGQTMNATQFPMSSDPDAVEGVRLARLDLAKRLGLEDADITVSAVIGQDFSTNAFYCRESKDRIARDDAPATISGWTILLKALGQRYEYHASNGEVVFCRSAG